VVGVLLVYGERKETLVKNSLKEVFGVFLSTFREQIIDHLLPVGS